MRKWEFTWIDSFRRTARLVRNAAHHGRERWVVGRGPVVLTFDLWRRWDQLELCFVDKVGHADDVRTNTIAVGLGGFRNGVGGVYVREAISDDDGDVGNVRTGSIVGVEYLGSHHVKTGPCVRFSVSRLNGLDGSGHRVDVVVIAQIKPLDRDVSECDQTEVDAVITDRSVSHESNNEIFDKLPIVPWTIRWISFYDTSWLVEDKHDVTLLLTITCNIQNFQTDVNQNTTLSEKSERLGWN